MVGRDHGGRMGGGDFGSDFTSVLISISGREGGWTEEGEEGLGGNEEAGMMPSFLSSAVLVRKSMEGRLEGLPSATLEGAPGECEWPGGNGDCDENGDEALVCRCPPR